MPICKTYQYVDSYVSQRPLYTGTPSVLAYDIYGILNEYIVILIILSLWYIVVLVFEFLGLG